MIVSFIIFQRIKQICSNPDLAGQARILNIIEMLKSTTFRVYFFLLIFESEEALVLYMCLDFF